MTKKIMERLKIMAVSRPSKEGGGGDFGGSYKSDCGIEQNLRNVEVIHIEIGPELGQVFLVNLLEVNEISDRGELVV